MPFKSDSVWRAEKAANVFQESTARQQGCWEIGAQAGLEKPDARQAAMQNTQEFLEARLNRGSISADEDAQPAGSAQQQDRVARILPRAIRASRMNTRQRVCKRVQNAREVVAGPKTGDTQDLLPGTIPDGLGDGFGQVPDVFRASFRIDDRRSNGTKIDVLTYGRRGWAGALCSGRSRHTQASHVGPPYCRPDMLRTNQMIGSAATNSHTRPAAVDIGCLPFSRAGGANVSPARILISVLLEINVLA